MGVKRRLLNRQVHTDPVPGPQKPLLSRRAGIRRHRLALADGVRWRDERAVVVLEHTDNEAVRKTFVSCVEVAEHCVAPPPPDDPDFFRVES